MNYTIKKVPVKVVTGNMPVLYKSTDGLILGILVRTQYKKGYEHEPVSALFKSKKINGWVIIKKCFQLERIINLPIPKEEWQIYLNNGLIS